MKSIGTKFGQIGRAYGLKKLLNTVYNILLLAKEEKIPCICDKLDSYNPCYQFTMDSSHCGSLLFLVLFLFQKNLKLRQT